MITRHSGLRLGVACAVGLGCLLAQAAAPPTPQGVITGKAFTGIGGTAVTDLTGNAKFPNNPDVVRYEPYFEWNATGNILNPAPDWADNYGVQMLGYFYPPSNGDYIFYLSSDDGGQLWLSTDADPANKKLIAQETGWSGARSYLAMGGGSTVEAKNSQTFTGTQWPTKDTLGGAKITLQTGRAYYIEALMKEGGGGDNLSVAVQDPNFAIDSTMPIPGQYLSSFDKTSGPVSIVTQPVSQTVNALETVIFRVEVNGTPPYGYQWKRNGGDIGGATGPSYTIDRATAADNGARFTVVVTGAQGTATSQEAVLTVNVDTIPPTIAAVNGTPTFNQLRVTFSEPVSPATAQAVGNYQLSGGVTISAAALGAAPNDHVVNLTTSRQPEGATLTLTVNNVQDLAGNAIAAGTTTTFRTHAWVPGVVLHEFWQDVPNNIAGLTADPRFPHSPTMVTLDPMFEYPPNGGNEGGSNYGNKLSAWFIAPATGDYVFFVNGDDPAWLYLSTDADPANKKLIAQETGWSGARQWNSAGSGDPLSKRSDSFLNSEWPHFPNWIISLTAGQRYYIEALHTEGGGGDNVAATFVRWGDPDPANGSAPALTGNVIGSYLDPNGIVLDITQQPQSLTAVEDRRATFTVEIDAQSAYGPIQTYQWQSAPAGSSTFTDIAGATAATYTTDVLTLAQNGRQYRVVIRMLTVTATSDVATLTVIPDTFAPEIAGAGGLASRTGNTFDVGVLFDEPISQATATVVGNYSVSGGTVSAVTFYPRSPGVVLTVSGLTAGNVYSVTVRNVADMKGNAIGEATLQFRVSPLKWGVVGGNELGLGNGVLPIGGGGFDLYSDGIGEWATYDEATFVYEEVTGDFDKKLRVEYQDNSSQWARAGLIARDVTNIGVNRTAQEGGQAGRYQKVHVNPVGPTLTGPGTAGNAAWEGNRRLLTGGATDSAGGGGFPQYPNAWCRMVRVGQTITIYRSDDGVNWIQLGATTWADDPETGRQTLPATLFVGPEFSPENGNITNVGDRGVWLARIREYGNFVADPSVVSYGIGLNFGADEANGSRSGAMPSIGTAGVPAVRQANWNNLDLLSGTATGIVADKRGESWPTSVTVEWNSNNTWCSTGRGEENNQLTGYNRTLMTGYLDTAAATTSTVTIQGLPADLTAEGYDVYVYLLGGVAQKGGGYRIVNPASGAILKDTVLAQCSVNPTAHVQAVPAAGSPGVGTYVLFTGLTAGSIRVEASTADGLGFGTNPRAPINAIQLVPTGSGVEPEPPEFTAIVLNADGTLTVHWTGGGTLQAAPTVNGPWQDVAGAASPYTFTPTADMLFGRIVK